MSPDFDKMTKEQIMSYANNLENMLKDTRDRLSSVQSEYDKLKNKFEGEDISYSFSGNFVIFDENGRPTCSEHGSMLCMDKPRGMWRCPTCHIGCSTHDLLNYIQKEFDGDLSGIRSNCSKQTKKEEVD